MLLGTYNQNVDAKGRVNVPSKFRADLGQTFVIAKGLNNCIAIHPKEEWEKFMTDLLSESPTNRRKLQMFFAGGSSECEIDSQGRVVIPPALRKYAGLSKEIVVVGMFTHAEIWDKDSYEAYTDDPSLEPDKVEEAMREFGL